ncbi:hypothetical protein QBC32DRAFT_354858, partial [Pseudoneurospora amorphoporcata]
PNITWEHVTLDHFYNKYPLEKLSFAVLNCDTFRGIAVDRREYKGVLRLIGRGYL